MSYEAYPFWASMVIFVKLIGNSLCVHLLGVHYFLIHCETEALLTEAGILDDVLFEALVHTVNSDGHWIKL